jgi:uncharacterized membrane protein YbhN (UPF0104 family)
MSRTRANLLELIGAVGQYGLVRRSGRRQMGSSAVDGIEAAPARAGGGVGKAAAVAVKVAVTAGCFWYISRQIDLSRVIAGISSFDPGWVAGAMAAFVLQVPVVALRWRRVLGALVALPERATVAALTAVTAIGIFFAQVLPSVAGDGIRAWFAHRLGCDWRNAVSSVAIDRGVGLGLLLALGFAILLLQSEPLGLSGYREYALGLYGALLLVGMLVLLLIPRLAAWLAPWRVLRWLGYLLGDARRVVIGPSAPMIIVLGLLVHGLTVVAVWSMGRALGLMFSMADATILFTIMVGVTSVPISISGWGLRELAVVSLLGRHGVSAENALLFSVGFGIVLALASLPGALVWLLYSGSAPAARERRV